MESKSKYEKKEDPGFPSKLYYGFFMSWGCFTAIPCPNKIWHEAARNMMLETLKFVGLVVGIIEIGLYCLADWLGIPNIFTGAVLTVYPFLITGCIHLDGFMDCCDAISSRRPIEEKRKILKDSRVGAFAVTNSIFLILIYFASVLSILEGANSELKICILAIGYFITRMMSAHVLMNWKTIEGSQYESSSKETGNFAASLRNIGIGIAVIVLFEFAVWRYFCEILPSAFISPLFCWLLYILSVAGARRQLKGISGDIAGYSLVIGETAMAVSLAVIGC